MLHELHITVERPSHVVGINRAWASACEMTGSKPLLIELQPQGSLQMMMNAQVTDTPVEDRESWVCDRVAVLPNEFKVVRIKAEVPLDKGIAEYPNPEYYECHVKLLMEPWMVQNVVRVAHRMGWGVSRNLYLPRDVGMEKWYLTQRLYPSQRPGLTGLQAAREFHDQWASIQPNMPPAARMEMETVVSDTNPSLDAGWV